jgi:hypothetical protein
MEPPLILEVLDRFGKVKERVKVRDFPCRIGRNYDNDIILDDPYISPSHVELILDGNNNVVINDLRSVNGMYSLAPLKRQDSLALQDNQRIRIGQTDLRFRTTAFMVKETIQDLRKPHSVASIFGSALTLPLVWALLSAFILWNSYLESVTDVTFTQLLGKALPIFILLPLWAFAWSIVSKVVTHKFYFIYHAVWVSIALLILMSVGIALEYAEFATSMDFLNERATLVSDILLIAILFYGHLRYSTTYSKKTSGVVATLTAILLVFIITLLNYLSQPEFSNQPQFSTVLKPPAYILRDSSSVDGFFLRSDSLKQFSYDNDTSGNQ